MTIITTRALAWVACLLAHSSSMVAAQKKNKAPERDLDNNITRLYLVHMIFMILAWLLFAPAAILLARFGRTLFTWYPHHRNLNILTVVFVIIGFATSVAAMIQSGSGQWEKNHHIVGLVIFLLVFVQSAMGLAAHKIRARPSGHRWMGYIHAPIGLLLFGLAVWNIETGFDLWEWKAGNAPKIFVYVWMAVLVAAYAAGLLLIPREIKKDKAYAEEKKLNNGSESISSISSPVDATPRDTSMDMMEVHQTGPADVERQAARPIA